MTTISQEILAGTIDGYDKKVKNVAKNVSNYILSKHSGHLSYGIGYLVSQVYSKQAPKLATVYIFEIRGIKFHNSELISDINT